MTPRQIELARHALGLPNKRRCSYRNHFVAGRGHNDYTEWCDMTAPGNGYAIRLDGGKLTGNDFCFVLTEKGAKAALSKGEKLDPEDFPVAA